ncbi:MAG: cytochrome c [Acidobacteria bacterium]|nr:MAG: cytochrome c [Acidobacteriota bacterium]
MHGNCLISVKRLKIAALALALPAATVCWGQSKSALSPAAKAGQKVFAQQCALCHYADQTKNKIGPGLKGILKNKELPFSHKPATVANVREQIEKGNPQGKPMPMPPFAGKISAKDLNNLVDYLKTL